MGEDERPTPDQASPVSLALAWATGACAAVFVALVALPSAFVLAGLLRSGDASVAARLSLLPGVLAVAWHPNAWSDDPVRAATTAAGLLAGVACVLMAAAMAAQRGRGRRLVEPLAAQRAYLVCLAGLAVSAGCLLAASFVLPVPARPLEWWMLAIGLALPTAWLAARRLWAWPAVVMLAAAGALGMAAEAIASRGASLDITGGALLLAAAAAATVAAAAAVGAGVLAAPAPRREAGAGSEETAGGPPLHGPAHLAPMALSMTAATALGLAVISGSMGSAMGDPSLAFPAPSQGSRAVVVVPHIDDESAFAGETIAWLAAHGYPVTLVIATDSRGGRAMSRHPNYRRHRDAALSAALRDLGVSDVRVFEDVPDGARISRRRMTAAITRDLAATGLLAPGTVLLTISGTGHSNHASTFAAVSSLAARARLPLYVAWGYDAGHDLAALPTTGTPLPFDPGPQAADAKARAVDDYLRMYEDDYLFTLPRSVVLSRGTRDVLSVIAPPSTGRVAQ